MAYTTSNSSSNSKVKPCSKECLKSFEAFQKQYDQQYEAFKKSHLQIIAYQVGLESVEARIVVHQKNEAVYEEDIALLKLDVQLRDTALTGLGYGNHVNGCEANDSKSVIDKEDSPVNDRFMKSNGNHAIPPPYTGNYMPPRADLSFAGLDDSVYMCKVIESISNESKVKTNVTKSCTHSIEKPKTDRPSALLLKSGNLIVIMIALLVLSVLLRLILLNLLSVLNVGTGQRETRPVWDNTARVNHQKKLTHPHPKRNFVPAAILTKSRQVLVNAAKQSSHKAAASVSATRHVNTTGPNVNNARPKTTQDLVIIKLIQRVKRMERELKARTLHTKIQKRVKRLERELKARTLPIKIQKVDRGRSRSVMAWVPKMV
nr:hypothetical protein [Tanacetum cinerariifolium]